MRIPDGTPLMSGDLRDRVLARLGFSRAPSPDLDGLRALYAAWCAHVPFDNVRKMIVLRADGLRPLPGGDAADFFEHWLANGAGGTCWPSSNALFELARACGFAARRVAGSMRDLGIINHASVKVRIDGADWLVDSSALTNEPLPVDGRLFVTADPVFAAEVEPVDGTHIVWTHTPPNSAYLPCRLLVDPADHVQYASGYEASRTRSPFNQRLYVRRNHPGELVVLIGSTRFIRTAHGLESQDLSPDELRRTLAEQVGLSDTLIAEWVRCGGLAASFEPPSGPKPPPVTGLPPSRR